MVEKLTTPSPKELRDALISVLTLQEMTLSLLLRKGVFHQADIDFMESVLGASPELAYALDVVEQAKNSIPEA
ncbi:hypothetical protein JI664_03500 [Rhodobacter sp. NTK016B]|uniref:hypothetical protein n=1 Tax=Rhodobacter sp. NTK016B TaxID=2759676 RepID=UPI001A9024D5|nr:hypothetical protein [Rhodobacter sp. NTK016B]MBN8291022.1 hypothetical protein [Rhodobacter sp. NTK016B]